MNHVARLLVTGFAAFLVSLSIQPGVAYGQLKMAMVRVDGLSCPFCAYGLEKKLKAIEGVGEVKIDLKAGIAHLWPKEESWIAMEAVKKAVKEGGFTPRAIMLTVEGAVSEETDGETGLTKVVLQVSGTDRNFLLLEDPEGDGPKVMGHVSSGDQVLAAGRLYDHKPVVNGSRLPQGLIVERLELVTGS